jgi:N-acetylglutamate synthase-like GNAT family acetyltransferase
VVVDRAYQGRGLGRQIVEGLLKRPCLRRVERVYLMTTNSSGFYQQLGFDQIESQLLMMKQTSG